MRTRPASRRGVTSLAAAGALFASALAGAGLLGASSASAEEPAPVPALGLLDVDAFVDEAAELPAELVQAIEEDLGLSPAEYLAHATAAKTAADVVDGLEDAGVGIEAAEVDGQSLTVHVSAESDVPAVEAAGATAKVGKPETDTSLHSKPRLYPHAEFRGGYAYAGEDAAGAFWCSAGFNGTTSDGSPVFLTAGHCGAGLGKDAPWYWLDVDGPVYDSDALSSNWKRHPLGRNGTMRFGPQGNDGGLVHVTEPGWELVPEVAQWGGGDGAPEAGETVKIYDSADVIVGQPVCKSGATSGWKCGKVLHAEDTVELSTGQKITGFIFTACMLGGDSGGAIVSGNYALGVDSFSTEDAMDSCSTWTPATSYKKGGYANGDISGGFAVTSGSVNAETLFGDDFNLMVHVGKPKLTVPKLGRQVSPNPTLRGTADAAEGARVTVEIDGDVVAEGEVGADGAWSVPVAESLEPGPHRYTATITHTPRGGSEPTSSNPVTGMFVVTDRERGDLTVDEPASGDVTDDARLTFSGTGEPGAAARLVIDGEEYGQSQVGDDGAWTIEPAKDLPIGARFDAQIVQGADDSDDSEVVVAGLGVKAPAVTITSPKDGQNTAQEAVVAGTSYPGASVTVRLQPADGGEPVTVGAEVAAGGDWSYRHAGPLPQGDYVVTASAQRPDGDPELGAESATEASFAVGSGGENSGGELPDTGTSGSTWLLVAGVALLVVGGAVVALRARGGGSRGEDDAGGPEV